VIAFYLNRLQMALKGRDAVSPPTDWQTFAINIADKDSQTISVFRFYPKERYLATSARPKPQRQQKAEKKSTRNKTS
jgi:hypothetical protein